VLERGSVEGQVFHSAAVAALVTPPAPVERELVGLVRADLVRPDRPQLPVGDAYRFRHLLIRDAAYDSLPKTTRAQLHERFASWLEARGTDLVERDEIVGYHLEQAYGYRAELGPVDAAGEALARQAAERLARAGRVARLRGDHPGAARLLSRAAAFDSPGRLELLPELAEMLFETGELRAARAVLDDASASARAAGDEGVAAVAAVWRAMIGGHLADEGGNSMERTIEEAATAARVLEDAGRPTLLASVLSVGGRTLFYVGRSREAAVTLEHARRLALECGDLHRARDAIRWEGAALSFGSTPVSEVRAWFEALPMELREILDHDPTAWILDTHMSTYSGEFELGRQRFQEAVGAMADLGMRVHSQGMGMFLGVLELHAGEDQTAATVLRESFDALGRLGEAGFRSTVGTLLADALERLGRLDEAEEVLGLVAELAAPDDCDPQVRMRAVLARILTRRGDLAAALATGEEAVGLASRTDYLVLHGEALLALAGAQQASGADEAARESLRQALELFEAKEDVPQAARTRAQLAVLEPAPPARL
jgi:tetratricopeptide (TPR) repeat protein